MDFNKKNHCAFAQFNKICYICTRHSGCVRKHFPVFTTTINLQMAEKIRIKDIAELAGVSVGTIDRILHNRPNVSKSAREKVEKVLKKINYKPNMYAAALAYNKSYSFMLLLPKHESEAYWEEIEEGVQHCAEARRDFNITVEVKYYKRFDAESFNKSFNEILDQEPNGVVIVPSDLEITQAFTDKLHEREIPFILLDSYMPTLNPLSFFGQDSLQSGYFAAKMLMLIANKEKEIMLMKQMKNGKVASKQQENREVGFRQYMHDYYPGVKIHELNLPLDEERSVYDDILQEFFDAHPDVHHCITMCSKAHLVGEFLLRTNRKNIKIMGYDMVGKNAECLRQGSISFLIAQHAFMQGYNCIDTLFKAIILKQEVSPVNYMPIELLSRENVEFYRRTQL